MLRSDEPVTIKALPDGFSLRTVSTLEELERVSELDGSIHGPEVTGMTYKLFAYHPNTSGRDLPFIQNEKGEVVSSLCLIPWNIRYGGADLPIGELGIVGTDPRFRRMGFNQILMDYFWQRFQERGCMLSIIQGIPNFYRQYGYEYSHWPLSGGWRLQADQVPQPIGRVFRFRPAASADIPALKYLFDQQSNTLDIHTIRTDAIWQYLLDNPRDPEAMRHDTWLVENETGKVQGYFRIPHYDFFPNLLTVNETSRMDFEMGLSVLNFIKGLAVERGKDGLRFVLPPNADLQRLARSLGAATLGLYSWQVKVPDWASTLYRLAPMLENRLAGSMFAGMTRRVCIDLYKEILALDFINGKLTAVGKTRDEENIILRLPAAQLVPLALGGNSLEEIAAIYTDASVCPPWGTLVETLFPKTRAFLYTIY